METAALTIFIGVIVIVAGQLIIKLFIDPVNELRLEIGRVAHTLVFWANVYHHPMGALGDREMAASAELRERASAMSARGQAVFAYWFVALLHLVPPWHDLMVARGELIALSNIEQNVRDTTIEKQIGQIEKALRLRKLF